MLIIANELAARTREAVGDVVAQLQRTRDAELVICRGMPDLETALDRRDGRALVVLGGDGSLHTSLRLLWQRGEAAQCPVGLVPLGTGNDFARGVGIPLDPVAAARVVLEGLPYPIDLVSDDAGGVVVNAMHVGVGADAAATARPLKPFLRVAAFPIGAVLAGVRAKGWRVRVEVDGAVVASGRRRVLMAGFANAPTIAGGTAVLGPGASVTDGLIDVTVSLAVGPLARIGYALRLRRGTHPDRADVRYRQGRSVTIRGEPFDINADGEIDGPVRVRTWTVRPAAWRLILPVDARRPASI